MKKVLAGLLVVVALAVAAWWFLPRGDSPGGPPRQHRAPDGSADHDLADGAHLRSRRVEVEVVDAVTGAPVHGAQVSSPAASHLAQMPPHDRGNTGPDGHLTLAEEDEESFTVIVRHDDYLPESTDVKQGAHAVRVALRKGQVVRGRITTAAGAPIEGVSVTLTRAASDWFGWIESGASGTDGSFQFTRALPGRWRASVHFKSGLSVWPQLITVEEGSPTTLTLVAAGGPCTLRLAVVSAAGEKVTLMAVLLQGSVPLPTTLEGWNGATAAGLQGTDSRSPPIFVGVDRGHYTVLLMTRGLSEKTVGLHRFELDAVPGDHTVHIALPAKLPQIPSSIFR